MMMRKNQRLFNANSKLNDSATPWMVSSTKKRVKMAPSMRRMSILRLALIINKTYNMANTTAYLNHKKSYLTRLLSAINSSNRSRRLSHSTLCLNKIIIIKR